MTGREKIVEAMARALCEHDGPADDMVDFYTYEVATGTHSSFKQERWKAYARKAEDALTAIADHGYAVVKNPPSSGPSQIRLIGASAE